MFLLITERSNFYRVKRGQTAEQVIKTLKTPAPQNLYGGQIIPVCKQKLYLYAAEAGESYKSIAKKFNAEEEELKKLNGGKPVYPTAQILVAARGG